MEFGVFKGCSLIRLAYFRHMLETPEARKIVAFDAFGHFPVEGVSLEADRRFIADFTGGAGQGCSKGEIKAILDFKDFKNIELVDGDVKDSFPKYLRDHPNVRFNLAHLDMDVYEPTAFVLPEVYERTVRGGLLMIDDYGLTPGATKAFDEFISAHSELTIRKDPLTKYPSYILKP